VLSLSLSLSLTHVLTLFRTPSHAFVDSISYNNAERAEWKERTSTGWSRICGGEKERDYIS